MKTAIALIALISLSGSLVWAEPNQQQVQDIEEMLGNAQDAAKQDEYDVDLQSLPAAAQDNDDNDDDVKYMQSHASEQDEDEDMQSIIASEQDEDEDMPPLKSRMAAAQEDAGDDGDDENMKALTSLSATAENDEDQLPKASANTQGWRWPRRKRRRRRYGARYYQRYYNQYYKRYYNNYYARYYNKYYSKYYARYYHRYYNRKFKGAKAYGNYGFGVISHVYKYMKSHYPNMYRKHLSYKG